MEFLIGFVGFIATAILFRYAKQYGYGEIETKSDMLKPKRWKK